MKKIWSSVEKRGRSEAVRESRKLRNETGATGSGMEVVLAVRTSNTMHLSNQGIQTPGQAVMVAVNPYPIIAYLNQPTHQDDIVIGPAVAVGPRMVASFF